MDLYQLRSFYEVVREQSFTRAADKLFLTQPAISLQIKALENELDEILLERNRRQLRLTPAGEILFAHAKVMLSQSRAGARRYCGAQAGLAWAAGHRD